MSESASCGEAISRAKISPCMIVGKKLGPLDVLKANADPGNIVIATAVMAAARTLNCCCIIISSNRTEFGYEIVLQRLEEQAFCNIMRTDKQFNDFFCTTFAKHIKLILRNVNIQ